MPDGTDNSYTPIRDTVKGKRLRFFDADGVDEMVAISMALAQELWTVKARVDALERAAAKHDLDLGKEADAFMPSPEEQQELEAQRQAFIDRVFHTLREEAESLEHASKDEPDAPEVP